MLSKSDYLLFLKHPAWLWLKKHDKKKLGPVDASLQSLFDEGYLFESYAQQIFPDGVRIGFSDYDEYFSQPMRTKKAIDDGATTIFQGRFEAGAITAICDVLVFHRDKTVDLFEIKASAGVKPIHEDDLAFQLTVLEQSGYSVRDIYVLCVNAEYVKNGEIDPKQLVLEQNVTNAVKLLREETKSRIEAAQNVVASPVIPDISPVHCANNSLKEWLEIYRTLTDVPEGSVYDLCRLNVGLLEKFSECNVSQISDIPDDIELHVKQSVQVKVTKSGQPSIDSDRIREFCKLITYPVYFLDYETLSSVIPVFDGTKPYQQVPFQYSLHMLDKPDGELKHTMYLHTERSNPVVPLSESLQKHIGSTGTVLVWYEPFEKSKNAEMGELFPQFAAFYHDLNARVVDLMKPFSEGWYAHPGFLGSASIKSVLPVLIPEPSYAALDIHDGGTAQRIWMDTVLDGKNVTEREKIFSDLEAYCTLDTLAMVKIFQKLLLV